MAEKSESFGRALTNGIKWPRGKMLGGSGGLNAMMYFRGFRTDYNSWASLGNSGWDYESVEQYFEDIENTKRLNSSHVQRLDGKIPMDYYLRNAPEIGDTVLRAAMERNLPIVHDFNNGRDNIGYGNIYGNFGGGVRQSSARAYLIPAGIQRNNLHVVKQAVVNVVLMDRGSVVGVAFTKNHQNYIVKPVKEVILSAGTVNTPQLLMLSGIGPKDHLLDMGIRPEIDLPVGRNLEDHVYIDMAFKYAEFTEPLSPTANLDRAYEYLKNRGGQLGRVGNGIVGFINTRELNAAHPNLQFIHVFYPRNSSAAILGSYTSLGYEQTYINQLVAINEIMATGAVFIILLNPKSRGEIKLRSKFPFDKPKIYTNYLDHPKDMQTVVEGLKYYNGLETTRAFRAAGAEFIRFKNLECPNYPSDEYWECYARHFTLTLYHPTGTAKMGPDNDSKAVVDPYLRVRGVDNLRVCDASIMPKIVSVNTNGASMMIGEKCADLIQDQWS